MSSTKGVSPDRSNRKTESSQREQALCRDAIVSEEFDGMTDEQWVSMCERLARESMAKEGAGAGSEDSAAVEE